VYSRIDIVYANSEGVGVVTGNFGENPVEPILPVDSVRVGSVLVTPTGGTVDQPKTNTYINNQNEKQEGADFWIDGRGVIGERLVVGDPNSTTWATLYPHLFQMTSAGASYTASLIDGLQLSNNQYYFRLRPQNGLIIHDYSTTGEHKDISLVYDQGLSIADGVDKQALFGALNGISTFDHSDGGVSKDIGLTYDAGLSIVNGQKSASLDWNNGLYFADTTVDSYHTVSLGYNGLSGNNGENNTFNLTPYQMYIAPDADHSAYVAPDSLNLVVPGKNAFVSTNNGFGLRDDSESKSINLDFNGLYFNSPDEATNIFMDGGGYRYQNHITDQSFELHATGLSLINAQETANYNANGLRVYNNGTGVTLEYNNSGISFQNSEYFSQIAMTGGFYQSKLDTTAYTRLDVNSVEGHPDPDTGYILRPNSLDLTTPANGFGISMFDDDTHINSGKPIIFDHVTRVTTTPVGNYDVVRLQDLTSGNCAVMVQVGAAVLDHFHFAFLTKDQASSLVSRAFNSGGFVTDNDFIRAHSEPVVVTTTEEGDHTHTISVNYNPYTQKFFIYEETIPEGHTAFVLLQDSGSGGTGDVSATNGLSLIDGSIGLGGLLGGDTEIDVDTHYFSIISSNHAGEETYSEFAPGGVYFSSDWSDGGSYFQLNGSNIQLLTNLGSGNHSGFSSTADGTWKFRDDTHTGGLMYYADYSAYFTDNSLVTKKWVQDFVGSGLGDIDVIAALGYTPEDISKKNIANGYAGLNSSGLLPISLFPDRLLGNVKYKGTYNGTTDVVTSSDSVYNGLALPAASDDNQGVYFISTTDYTHGSINYKIGDWIISNGVAGGWDRVENSDAVTTVFGRNGNVVANSGDYAAYYAPLSGGTNYIQNQFSVLQTADIKIQGQIWATKLGLGTSDLTNYILRISTPITGAASMNGFVVGGTIQPDVNSSFVSIGSTLSFAAGGSMPTLYHFRAAMGAVNSSPITSLYGFAADATLGTSGATNAYGFYGNLASGGNTWNYYGVGTAGNYMASYLNIGSTTQNVAKLFIAGTATGTTLVRGIYMTPILPAGANSASVSAIEINPSYTNPGTGILTTNTLVVGSGYLNGSYPGVALTGGTGSGAIATIVVAGGGISTVTVTTNGTGYTAGDTLSAAASFDGVGSGSGFSINVATIGYTGVTNYAIKSTGTGIVSIGGNVNVGPTTATNVSLYVNKNITGASTAYGIFQNAQVQIDVGVANIYGSSPGVIASGNISTLSHFITAQGNLGSGATITTQVGFNAGATMTGATTNIGFRGLLAAATGRYNLYMDGTAQNYIVGNLGLGINTPFSKLQIGASTGSSTTALSSIANFFGADSTNGQLGLFTTDAAAVGKGASINLGGESGNTTTPYYFATIKGQKDDATAAKYGGALVFYTTSSGDDGNTNSAAIERARIDRKGNFGLGTVGAGAISARLHAVSTTEQLRLGYNDVNFASFTVTSSGSLSIVPSSGGITMTANLTATSLTMTGTNNNLMVGGISAPLRTSAAQYEYIASTVNNVRVGVYGSTSAVLTAGDTYSAFMVANAAVTKAATGTHPWLSSVVIRELGAVTGSAVATNTATLFIGGASTAGTNNYSIYVDSGITYLKGGLQFDMGSDADGDIYIRSGGKLVRLPKGVDGTTLKMVSGLPAWV
jgi:hypothetical protein